ncbi:hypothetical protein [Alkalihalobacterium bogoriense]|uniref:hypothetical protein n=1 Tax=Alkalihalobacterium bogoriense TaxID=246272 RepID=UPI000479EB49|nr:hypothetical protein [Alkalihalobacterium bogoriense]
MEVKKIKQKHGLTPLVLGNLLLIQGVISLFIGNATALSYLLIGIGIISVLLSFAVKTNKLEAFELEEDQADKQRLESASRMMIIPSFDVSRTYTFYDLQGNSLGVVREQPLTKMQVITRTLFSIAALQFILPQRSFFRLDEENVITIDKRGGLRTEYEIFDENGMLALTYKREKGKYAHIYNRAGELVCTIDKPALSLEIKMLTQEENQMFRMQISGIPTEAMQMFGEVDGDIIDISHEHIQKDLYYPFLCLLVIMSTQHRNTA